MVGIVTQGSEARLLQEGINAVTDIEFKDYEMEYSKIFTVEKRLIRMIVFHIL